MPDIVPDAPTRCVLACHNPAMQWDVFCQVIDNFGDIGVCWRLAVDLGQRGHQVRLWVDDASVLNWMAPHVHWSHDAHLDMAVGLGQAGVTVHHWRDAERNTQTCPPLQPGDVVIEAFGCNPPDAFVARMQRPLPPQWVNLEYLSAEDYVERSHGLYSPVWSGPGSGLRKRFFYPGFTVATGGLLREPNLIAQRQAFGAVQREAWLASLQITLQPHAQVVSLFCYAHAPVAELLTQLSQMAQQHQRAVHVLLTPGHAQALAQTWQASQDPSQPATSAHLHLHALPHLPQADFDKLLWASDLNLVRGEDSAVRALWAARPHIWQIYEQDDGVHADKLDAFMKRWMPDWPAPLRTSVQAWWRWWNGLGPMPAKLPDWRNSEDEWGLSSADSCKTLCKQPDLVTQLTQFVTGSG
jgi:uncharacterized repeat protein (TIGR03837 family)